VRRVQFFSIVILLFIPVLYWLLKCPESEIQANTDPAVIRGADRGSILDRTGTLLAYTTLTPDGRPKRVYPYGDLARAIIGATGPWGRGAYGIELLMDEPLAQKKDVYLTLEWEVQIKADEILSIEARRFRSRLGCFILMDADTGQILALSTMVKDEAGQEDLAIKARYNPYLLFMPIRWIKDQGTWSQADQKGQREWIHVSKDLSLWSPWNREQIEHISSELAPVTRELIDLGFGDILNTGISGKETCKLPLYVNDLAREDFQATPLYILRAFSALIGEKGLVKPFLVMDFKKNPRNAKKIQWINKERRLSLLNLFSRFTTPALASIWWNESGDGKRPGCEILALGYWPEKRPRIVYITALKGASLDPIRRPGYLSMAKKALRLGISIPLDELGARPRIL